MTVAGDVWASRSVEEDVAVSDDQEGDVRQESATQCCHAAVHPSVRVM